MKKILKKIGKVLLVIYVGYTILCAILGIFIGAADRGCDDLQKEMGTSAFITVPLMPGFYLGCLIGEKDLGLMDLL